MRFSILSCVAVLAAGSVQLTAEGKPCKSDPHVRPLQDEGRRLLAIGMTRSPTFRRLLARLDDSNVIVYVDVTVDVPAHCVGVLRFLTTTRSSRFLVVRLNRMSEPAALVGILGHELQHAVEVADANGVNSAEDLARLYRRIGVETGPAMYDTEAARRAGDEVRAEAAHGNRGVAVAATMGRIAGRR